MGGTINMHGKSQGVPGSTSSPSTNLLRYYDINDGYTFNMGEFSIKRDPDEKFPFGEGLVLTAGQDSQKNHSIGILRSETDVFPFRNTPWFDLQEGYISARVPVGEGPVIKVGKFVSLLGYEVIESPSNLNYSRGYLFTLATPMTTTGVLASYTFTDWLSVQAGPRPRAGIARTWRTRGRRGRARSPSRRSRTCPSRSTSSWGRRSRGTRTRSAGSWTSRRATPGSRTSRSASASTTGRRPTTCSCPRRGSGNKSAQWYGIAGYVAYDFLKDFRASLRQEWFADPEGTRTATIGGVTLFSTTATLQYNIWKGLFARAEYRHDNASEKVFGCEPDSPVTTSRRTRSRCALYYKFF